MEHTKLAHKALNELALDCFIYLKGSRIKRKRGTAREELAASGRTVRE